MLDLAQRIAIRQACLDWNREQADPPIKIGFEYSVADAICELLHLADTPPLSMSMFANRADYEAAVVVAQEIVGKVPRPHPWPIPPDDLNRRARVEQRLLDAFTSKQPLPDKDECRRLAYELGVPESYRTVNSPRFHRDVDQWIRLEDQLPEQEGRYPVIFQPGLKQGGRSGREEKRLLADWVGGQFWLGRGSPLSITHWLDQPLPSAPTTVDE